MTFDEYLNLVFDTKRYSKGLIVSGITDTDPPPSDWFRPIPTSGRKAARATGPTRKERHASKNA